MEGEMEGFLDYFLENHRNDNFSHIKYGNYELRKQNFEVEVLDWTLQYLQYMSCPASLEAGITKTVLEETKSAYLGDDQPDGKTVSGKQAFTSLSVLQNVTATVSEVCRRLKKEENFRNSLFRSKNLYPCSVHAIKNVGKKMEDRHIIIHDLRAIMKSADASSIDGDELSKRSSFYGIYDGHAGKDAASFSASHLYQFLVQSEHYPLHPVQAMFDAFRKTDSMFYATQKDEKSLKSGTTAVCAHVLGHKLYIAWLGDSEALLVRNGNPVTVTVPHKPERKDESDRISKSGGSVVLFGVWRVNGVISVSRAIGDFQHKNVITCEPDVTTVDMNGSEDFIILGSDGFWDQSSLAEAASLVFETLVDPSKDKLDLESVSQELVNFAKNKGSQDNISVLIVFLKPPIQLIEEHKSRSSRAKEEEIEREALYSGVTSTCKYVNAVMSTGENPFISQGDSSDGAFDSPGGGGKTFGDGSFSPESTGRLLQDDVNEEQFRRASGSMFSENADFIGNQDKNWKLGVNNFITDLVKPDSGFISPACNSSNKSSDEERKEEEEFLESQEVTKLLGGKPIEELLHRGTTPTPPVDETGSSLEEILAVARDHPDSIGEEIGDDDSDESSTDELKPSANPTTQNNNEHVSDSDDNDDVDFTFVKKQSQIKELLLDIEGEKDSPVTQVEASSIVTNGNGGTDVNGRHTNGISTEVGAPASVIIESQEAPNPDQASFILKAISEAQEVLPSPQEPVIEVISDAVNSQSPILEESSDAEADEERNCEGGRHIHELSNGSEESSSVSFNCLDDQSNFILKTPHIEDSTLSDIAMEQSTKDNNNKPSEEPTNDDVKTHDDIGLLIDTGKSAVVSPIEQSKILEEVVETIEEPAFQQRIGDNALPDLITTFEQSEHDDEKKRAEPLISEGKTNDDPISNESEGKEFADNENKEFLKDKTKFNDNEFMDKGKEDDYNEPEAHRGVEPLDEDKNSPSELTMENDLLQSERDGAVEDSKSEVTSKEDNCVDLDQITSADKLSKGEPSVEVSKDTSECTSKSEKAFDSDGLAVREGEAVRSQLIDDEEGSVSAAVANDANRIVSEEPDKCAQSVADLVIEEISKEQKSDMCAQPIADLVIEEISKVDEPSEVNVSKESLIENKVGNESDIQSAEKGTPIKEEVVVPEEVAPLNTEGGISSKPVLASKDSEKKDSKVESPKKLAATTTKKTPSSATQKKPLPSSNLSKRPASASKTASLSTAKTVSKGASARTTATKPMAQRTSKPTSASVTASRTSSASTVKPSPTTTSTMTTKRTAAPTTSRVPAASRVSSVRQSSAAKVKEDVGKKPTGTSKPASPRTTTSRLSGISNRSSSTATTTTTTMSATTRTSKPATTSSRPSSNRSKQTPEIPKSATKVPSRLSASTKATGTTKTAINGPKKMNVAAKVSTGLSKTKPPPSKTTSKPPEIKASENGISTVGQKENSTSEAGLAK